MQNEFYIGVDVGNYDTKTSNCSFVSGYSEAATKPQIVTDKTDYICKDGKYYILKNEPAPYTMDKTIDNRMGILTLMAIAKEMYYTFEHIIPGELAPAGVVKQQIEQVGTIYLGVGLPPTHMSTLKEKYIEYYRTFFNGGITFTYNDVEYSFKLGDIEVYPQNFSVVIATAKKDPESIFAEEDFYAIDFGGYTLDKITIINNKLVFDECDSLEKGILTLYDETAQHIRTDFGQTIDKHLFIKVLYGKRVSCNPKIAEEILAFAENWTHATLDELRQKGVNYQIRPTVFMGGTSLLLKKFIDTYPLLGKYEILDNPRVNADAYRKLIKHKVLKKKG